MVKETGKSNDLVLVDDNHKDPHFNEERLWEKLQRYALQAGSEVVELALTLYYTWRDPDTPQAARTVIVGALVYFIVPSDAVIDLLPGGYVDDWGALLGAMWAVASHIKDEHGEMARAKKAQWFNR